MVKCCPSCGTAREHLETLELEHWEDLSNGEIIICPEILFCPECHWEGTPAELEQREELITPDWHEDCREPY